MAKIAVYTIALNEEQFVKRWYESAKDADYLLIADTGSTDNTVKLAKKLGINVITIKISPWRFDDARNASLAALPEDIDYCVALDMDEVLKEGWRSEIENAAKQNATRIRYNYVWNWADEEKTTPGTSFFGDKIHARKGYRWKHPVHEVIVPYGSTKEVQIYTQLGLHHHADDTKSRAQYLPLLKMSVEEDPYDDRNAYYYARELFFYRQYEEAATQFKRHLALPTATWAPERASSLRYLAKIEPENRENWLLGAISEAPGRRESLVELAQHYYETENWQKCLNYALDALKIENKPLDFLCEDFAWGWLPYDLAAISYYHLKDYKNAAKYGNKALSLNSDSDRLKTNLAYYAKAAGIS